MRSEAYIKGQRYFLSGKPLKIPYAAGSVQYNEFESGWIQAHRGNVDRPTLSPKAELPDDWLQRRMALKQSSNDHQDETN